MFTGIHPTKNDRYCFIDPSRGYGDDEFVIMQFGVESCKLRDPRTQKHFDMYTAHLYVSRKSRAKFNDERVAQATSIGKPKKKPGKH